MKMLHHQFYTHVLEVIFEGDPSNSSTKNNNILWLRLAIKGISWDSRFFLALTQQLYGDTPMTMYMYIDMRRDHMEC